MTVLDDIAAASEPKPSNNSISGRKSILKQSEEKNKFIAELKETVKEFQDKAVKKQQQQSQQAAFFEWSEIEECHGQRQAEARWREATIRRSPRT